MAESVHVGEIAEKLSDELFREFFWQKEGPTNQDWPCEKSEEHGHATHPADVVFWYDEPYSQTRTYIHCDLKSFGKSSVKSTAVKKATLSLVKQIECAEISEEWQTKYTHGNVNINIVGLLFVYNHDTQYDGNFTKLMRGASADGISVTPGSRLFIFGPDDILWLDTVRSNIRLMRGDDGTHSLPTQDRCRYYYPQLTMRKNIRPDIAKAATLEMLTSPWIILEYDFPTPEYTKGYVLFYKRTATSIQEFIYVIDYLRHYQLLDSSIYVQIQVTSANTAASHLFSKAISAYISDTLGIDADEPLAKIIKRIKLKTMTQVVTQYSSVVLGMEYDRT
ncbi:hypothetical protein MKK55_07545 [Methylobacterium sp. J-059]|uniref:hypothetical protein n=1 Tax=Methylobacterium sp. J-059 TaxID=2836643 RepID=UPI001FB996A1|nr:hypothetical protein [Methylobacterium sp. J-059]MCJ2038809.1 hypothetical protein [Methylobacterium sp. J-059]